MWKSVNKSLDFSTGTGAHWSPCPPLRSPAWVRRAVHASAVKEWSKHRSGPGNHTKPNEAIIQGLNEETSNKWTAKLPPPVPSASRMLSSKMFRNWLLKPPSPRVFGSSELVRIDRLKGRSTENPLAFFAFENETAFLPIPPSSNPIGQRKTSEPIIAQPWFHPKDFSWHHLRSSILPGTKNPKRCVCVYNIYIYIHGCSSPNKLYL